MADRNLGAELEHLRIDRKRKRPPRRARRLLILLALVALVAAGALYYTRVNAAVPVKAVRAQRTAGPQAGEPVLTASGYIIPRDKIEVSSKIIGRIDEIYVDRGDRVQTDQVLLKIEDDEYQAQLRQAEAALENARARLAELLAGSRPEEIEAARARVASAEATLENSRIELDRVKELIKEEVVSRQAFDRIQTEFNVAAANLEAARKQYELVEKGPRQEEIDAARAAVAQAEANVAYAKSQLALTVIRSPIDGTILEKLADKGELLTFQNFGDTRGAKSSVLSMADLDDLQVEIDLNENDMPKVHLHQPAEIRIDSAPDLVMKGEVDDISPEADRQKATVQVKVRIVDPADIVRPEINARVTFLEDLRTVKRDAAGPRVFVPRAALVESPGGEGGTVVYVVQDGMAQARAVKTGDEGPRGVQILEGLNGDERVVVGPPPSLKSGMKVSVEA